MLLFFSQMFLMIAWARARACVCVYVVYWHCPAQLSMFNMEKRFRNKIIIIIIIINGLKMWEFTRRFWEIANIFRKWPRYMGQVFNI